MVVIGLILFGAAAAGAAVLIVQNQDGAVEVNALGNTWQWDRYWLVVAGLALALAAALGMAMMARGAARARRLRRERAELLAENAALGGHWQDPGDSPFF